MPFLIMSRPLLLTGETGVVTLVRPLADGGEITAYMFPVAVEIVLAYGREVLRWECQIPLTHDLLADVVDAVA